MTALSRPALRAAALLPAIAAVAAAQGGAPRAALGALPPAVAPPPHPDMPPPPELRAVRVLFNDSLVNPESVLYDAAQDVYFVSNIDGASAARDGNGFIARLRADGTTERKRFAAGGSGGAALNAPKGMAIVGDTLWVTDIDALRGFDRRSGAPLGSVNLAPLGAKFLNDVALGGDGALYITDTGITFDARGLSVHQGPDRVFRVSPTRQPSVALTSPALHQPNGIVWDGANRRFVIVPQGGDTVVTWQPGATAVQPLVAGPGAYDGVTLTSAGQLLVSSQATASVHLLQDGKLVEVIRDVTSPADIVFDPRHSRVAVPLLTQNRVEWYELR